MSESDPPPPKRGARPGNQNALHHGAPPGNRNAARHGFYSHTFTRQEHDRLDRDTLGHLEDEEYSLKFFISRIFEAIQKEEMTYEKYLMGARTVALTVGRIESIHRSRKAIYDSQTAMEKAMDELSYIPLEVD
jgi:hypothetical protein